jgi:hypothetical protein
MLDNIHLDHDQDFWKEPQLIFRKDSDPSKMSRP